MNQKQFQYLRLKTSKGFSFRIPNSIVLTTYPDLGIIFFLEKSVRFYDGNKFEELFQTQNPISAISLRGKFLAIGEKLMKGQLTTTTFLNLQTKKCKLYKYQKTAIQFLSLSANCEYLCSVGSSDISKQQLLIIDLVEDLQFGFKAVCEQQYQRKTNRIVAAKFANSDPKLLALTFATKFVIVKIDGNKSMHKVAKSSKVREFSMSIFQPQDMSCYVSSKNGDISQINIKQMKQVRIGPRKRVIISGIKFIRYVHPKFLIVIGVKGFIAVLQLTEMKIMKEVTIKEQIISITQFQGDLGFIGTDKSSIYILDAATLDIKQFYSCHSSKVSQICFLDSFNQVFATCADKQIILWKNGTLAPIIKISLPSSSCLSLNLLRDGTSIVSGWSDDTIRFFNPKTGKKINEISNAHNGKVTALTSNTASDLLFSGGEDGRIRSWKLEKERFGIIDNIFSGHKSMVHYLKLYGSQLYSCSEDGTFAIWDSKKAEKKALVKASNFLKKIIPIDDYLVYGVGSGPYLLKIAKNDGRIIQKRFVGGSHINDFDIFSINDREATEADKKYTAFGGELHSVFLHKIDDILGDEGEKPEQHYAYGEVTSIKFSPDGTNLIAGTADGSLLCFQCLTKGYSIN